MDQFIQNVKNIFDKEIVDIPKFINECSENLDKDSGYVKSAYQISTILCPLYYFFDNYLNKDIGAYVQHRDWFLYKTKIADMKVFDKRDRIIDIIYRNHATRFYIFQHKSNNYLYYSNSGLGIENQLNSVNSTSCKLFLINMPNITNFLVILENFIKILHIVEKAPIISFGRQTFRSIDITNQQRILSELEVPLNVIKSIITNFDITILNKDFLVIFFTDVISDKNINNYYYLIYTLLNYLASLNIMSECSFNDLLLQTIDLSFKSHIDNLYVSTTTSQKYTFTELYINCKNYNDTIYKNLQKDLDSKPIRNEYTDFLNDIHIELDRLSTISKVFDFKRKDIILDLKPSGLYNYKQKGGSCTFYSYYNLVLNRLFLNNCDLYLINKIKAVKNVVHAIMNIHYIMLYSFCVCNDIKYTQTDSSTNKIFHFNYLYNIFIKNDLESEISRFYPSSSLIIFSKRPLIDTLLDVRLEGYFESITEYRKIDSLIVQKTNLYYTQLNDYLNLIMNNIRNKNPVSILDIRAKLHTNRDNLVSITADFLESKCIEYIKIIYDIYLIYLWYFIELYQQPGAFKTKISNRKSPFYFLEIIYNIRDVDTSNCESQIQCMIKQCTYNTFDTNFKLNIDIFLNKFQFMEQYNLSKMLKNNYQNDIDKLNNDLGLTYCGFIFLEARIDTLRYYENMIYDNSIYTIHSNIKIYENIEMKISDMYSLISLFFRLNYLTINNNIDEHIKENYNLQLQNVINVIKNIIKENVNTRYDNDKFLEEFSKFDKLAYLDYSIFIFILSNKKYLLINEEIECMSNLFYNCLSIIRPQTVIIKGNITIEIIYQNIRHLLNDKNELVEFDNDIYTHSPWIANYNINIVNQTKFIKNQNEYLVLKPDYNSPVAKILSRFGCNHQNYNEFIILFPENQIDMSCLQYNSTPHNIPYKWVRLSFASAANIEYYNRPYLKEVVNYDQDFDVYEIKNLSSTKEIFNMYICIKKNKTIIELQFIGDKLNDKECYYYKEGNRYKLYFNIKLPFLALITETTPYLCYKNLNNTKTLIDVIITNANWFKSSSKYINFWEKENYIENIKAFEFKIIHFELMKSLLFPKPNTFNKIDYETIFQNYPSIMRIQITKGQLDSSVFIVDERLNQINRIIKNIAKLLTSNLSCDEHLNRTFRSVFGDELTDDIKKEKVIASFLEQNRLCITFNLTDEFISKRDAFIQILRNILDSIVIKHDFNMSEFIIKNLSNLIKYMIINTIIEKLEGIVKSHTTCWDIQNLLTVIDNIIFTIEKLIIPNPTLFLTYEILFLLQCSYFYRKSQFDKYKSILNDMVSKRDDLTLHQFMMGKGKTSVLTPLLGLSSNIKMGKIPNIITTEHLKKSTIEYLSMLYTVLDLKYEVMTDYEYKNIWLNSSDISLREVVSDHTISNYINIIDEFDLHHDYLQSMFNLVKKRKEISESFFNYIFDYINSKINPSVPFIQIQLKEISNYELFHRILDKEYENVNKLRYNKDYGFAYIFDKTDVAFDKDIRLCVPFSRKDTPLYNSNFSSILLTMILTVIYYINVRKNILDEKYDYNLVVKNYKEIMIILPENIFSDWISYIDTYDNLSIEKVKETFDIIYTDRKYNGIHKDIIKKFLYIVNQSKLYFALEQYNVSFQDVIYNVYPDQWQVGYTGTTYLNLNRYYEGERFVFRNKEEDFDEKIEVRLAIEAYGSPTDFNKNEVLTINIDTLTHVEQQIQYIMSHGFNRGLVDLAGLFLDYKNRDIAEYVSKIKTMNRIIYLNDNHQGIQYSLGIEQQYTPFHKDNFYYYDQCHTVGTDMEQPNDGYIGVIVNKNTKWTHFAQGIFRFRKLNHGTYMKIIYIHGNDERFLTPLTNKDIYKLIEKNEKEFQNNQELGIKYQLLKAMIRKISKAYIENNLFQEFMLSEPINSQHCIKYIEDNIIGLKNIIESTDQNPLYSFIKELYTSIVSDRHEDQLIKLITGNQSHQKQLEIDTSIEKTVDRNIVNELNIPSLDHFSDRHYDVITHLKCSECFNNKSFPLFCTDYNALINGKIVYVSLNLFNFNDFEIINTTPLIFVEFFDKILIEVCNVAIDYYMTKLPIYNFNGLLLNHQLHNKLNTIHPFKLDIDYRIIHIFNIQNYINPIKENNHKQITSSILDDVYTNLNQQTSKAFYSVYRNLVSNSNYFYIFFNRMPLLRYFVETYQEEEIGFIVRDCQIPPEENQLCDERQHLSNNRIDNISINKFDNRDGIDLTIDEYLKIERIHYNLIYHLNYFSFNKI